MISKKSEFDKESQNSSVLLEKIRMIPIKSEWAAGLYRLRWWYGSWRDGDDEEDGDDDDDDENDNRWYVSRPG